MINRRNMLDRTQLRRVFYNVYPYNVMMTK